MPGIHQLDQEYLAWTETNDIQSSAEAWAKLHRPDWMLWLADKSQVKLDESKLRLFACDCAEMVLPLFEKIHPRDKRPRYAIEMARRSTKNEITKEMLVDARNGARDAAAWDARAAHRAAGEDVIWDSDRDASRFAALAAASATWDDDWNAGADDRSAWEPTLTEAWEATAAARADWDAIWESNAAARAAVIASGAACWAIGYASKPAGATAWTAAVAAKAAAGTAAMTWQADRIRFYIPNPFGGPT